jgi:hypothetical protein
MESETIFHGCASGLNIAEASAALASASSQVSSGVLSRTILLRRSFSLFRRRIQTTNQKTTTNRHS